MHICHKNNENPVVASMAGNRVNTKCKTQNIAYIVHQQLAVLTCRTSIYTVLSKTQSDSLTLVIITNFRSVQVDGGITSIALRGQGHQVCNEANYFYFCVIILFQMKKITTGHR